MNLSIPKKLLIIILFPLLLDLGEIALFDFSANTFSAVRAYVNGESLWSKAQKDALSALQRYTVSEDEADFQEYLSFLEVPLGDRTARLALEKDPPDLIVANAGFMTGGNHPDDVSAMSLFFVRFKNVPYVRDAFEAWRRADEKLIELQALGEEIHAAIADDAPPTQIRLLADKLTGLNAELTTLETEFSFQLGTASRIAKTVLITSVLTVSILFFMLSIIVPVYLGRDIVRSIRKLKTAATEFETGIFEKVELNSNDELKELAETFNHMAEELNTLYQGLEVKVTERTQELEESKRSLEIEIQERKKLEGQLRAQAEALMRTDRMKDEFLATFAHELRNPLSPIVMTLELMELQKMDDREMQSSIDLIRRQTGYMTRIVNELLEMSRISLGKIELKLAPVDIREIVESAVETVQPGIGDKKQKLEVILPHQPLMVTADSLRIGQILINLLSNASKFTQTGGTISIRAAHEDDDVFVVVTDNGIGIASADLPQIFDPFFQGVAKVDENRVGLGIGLTLSKQLAQLHGGNIAASSPGRGNGSTFTLHLPSHAKNP